MFSEGERSIFGKGGGITGNRVPGCKRAVQTGCRVPTKWAQRQVGKVGLRGVLWEEGRLTSHTLPETNSSPLKIDPWNLGDSYWKPPF